MPDPERHAEDRNAIESILRRIPGFRGYLEKEYRRDSDHLARKWLADRVQQAKKSLDAYLRILTEGGQLDALPQFERSRNRLDGLMSKLRGNVRGYSGFFDFVRVDERVLDRVYDHDLSLMRNVDELLQSIDQLRTKSDAPAALADQLQEHLEDVERKYAQRAEILQGLQSEAM